MRIWLLLMLVLLPNLLIGYTFEETRDMLKTPAQVGWWVKARIKYVYQPDAVKYRSAREVFRSRTGGCTDYAQFAYEVLTYHGIPCDVYEVWNEKRGHAFVVYKNADGKYNCIDSMYGYSEYNRIYVKTIAKILYPDMTGYIRIKGTIK